MIKVAVAPGDGIGNEVLAGPIEVLRSLNRCGRVESTGPWPVGTSAYAAHGSVLPKETVRACEDADVILLGAVGEHPGAPAESYAQPSALWLLRRHFDFRLSIREVARTAGDPLVIVRNLLGGAYGDAGTRQEGDLTRPAWDRIELSHDRITEVAHTACDILAGYRDHELVSADKDNLFATSRLWRRTVSQVAADRGVEVKHLYIDRLAFELARELPAAVVLTEGIFGDILSDVAAARAGSIALCSSASVNPGPRLAGRCRALFEPVHGSAPRRTGQGVVNPSGAYLALAAALGSDPSTRAAGVAVRTALADTIGDGYRTYDMPDRGRPPISTAEFSGRVNDAFERYGRSTGTAPGPASTPTKGTARV
jgi:isocitrate/isopropylmalate dehydrogenase